MSVVTLRGGVELSRDAVVEWSVQEPDEFVSMHWLYRLGVVSCVASDFHKRVAGVLWLLLFSVIHVLCVLILPCSVELPAFSC